MTDLDAEDGVLDVTVLREQIYLKRVLVGAGYLLALRVCEWVRGYRGWERECYGHQERPCNIQDVRLWNRVWMQGRVNRYDPRSRSSGSRIVYIPPSAKRAAAFVLSRGLDRRRRFHCDCEAHFMHPHTNPYSRSSVRRRSKLARALQSMYEMPEVKVNQPKARTQPSLCQINAAFAKRPAHAYFSPTFISTRCSAPPRAGLRGWPPDSR